MKIRIYSIGIILLMVLTLPNTSAITSIRTSVEISGNGEDIKDDVLWSVNTGSLYEPGHYEPKGLVTNFPHLDILSVSYNFNPSNGTMISSIQLADTPQMDNTYFSFQFSIRYQNGTNTYAIGVSFHPEVSRAGFHYDYSGVNHGGGGGASLEDGTFSYIAEGNMVHFYAIIPIEILEKHPIKDFYNETNSFYFSAYTSEHLDNIDELVDYYTEENEKQYPIVEYEETRRGEYYLPFIYIAIFLILFIILLRSIIKLIHQKISN